MAVAENDARSKMNLRQFWDLVLKKQWLSCASDDAYLDCSTLFVRTPTVLLLCFCYGTSTAADQIPA